MEHHIFCKFVPKKIGELTGYYLYITDESGVGEEHLEGSVEERPVVEYLNDALVRLINGYHSGHFADPIPYGQINQQ